MTGRRRAARVRVSRRTQDSPVRKFPRSARVNEILREVVADTVERLSDVDERLSLLTVTAVDCEPDLRHAVVLLSSLDEEEAVALSECRVRIQAAISAQVRLKRTPQLSFAADEAVAAGERVEEIIRHLHERDRRGPAGEPGVQ